MMRAFQWLATAGLVLLAACGSRTPSIDPSHRASAPRWAPELVGTFAEIPVQHEGRIKPLGTLAAFSLYFIHGRRDLQFRYADEESPRTLTPAEWVLDLATRPKQADDYPLFRIENRQVLDAIGSERDGGQRMNFDFLSYAGLLPFRDKLQEQARDASRREGPDQSPLDRAILRLWSQCSVYEDLQGAFAPYQFEFPLQGEALQQVYGGKEKATLVELLTKGRELAALVQKYAREPSAAGAGNVLEIGDWLASTAEGGAERIALFPPIAGGKLQDAAAQEKWHTTGELFRPALQGRLEDGALGMLTSLERGVDGDPAGWEEFLHLSTAAARVRGEAERVALEVGYYRWSLHYKALHWGFLPAFLCVVVLWLLPRNRLLWWLGMGLTSLGTLLVIGDIALRCWLRQRPPITNLYDTFLFITSVGCLVALVTETINRRRVALSIAPIFGSLLVMLARKFEVEDGQDTMKQLQAVLDSNYWLATHVTTINIGYAAGMIAALLGTTWLVLGLLRIRPDDEALHKSVVRMTYGATAFGLVFAVVGTILGGVWANDSWGRFWGWDTKENGALMICLVQAALLHARMGGMVRDLGFCTGAALQGMVVAFSWFHVNQLQVGLHNYGFSESTGRALAVYYAAQFGLIVLGFAGRVFGRPAASQAAGPGRPPMVAGQPLGSGS